MITKILFSLGKSINVILLGILVLSANKVVVCVNDTTFSGLFMYIEIDEVKSADKFETFYALNYIGSDTSYQSIERYLIDFLTNNNFNSIESGLTSILVDFKSIVKVINSIPKDKITAVSSESEAIEKWGFIDLYSSVSIRIDNGHKKVLIGLCKIEVSGIEYIPTEKSQIADKMIDDLYSRLKEFNINLNDTLIIPYSIKRLN